MKKHLYFFISSIINILLSIYAIINCNEIVKELTNNTSMLPDSLKDKVNDLYINNGNIYIIVMSIICILINVLIIISIKRKSVTRKKFLTLSIFGILFSQIDLIAYLFILNLVLCITIKNDIITKNEIPKLELERNKKYIRNSLILILVYLSQYFIKYKLDS